MEKEMEEVFDRKVREKEKKLNETEVELRQKLKEAQEKLDEQREDLEEKMAAYDKVCTRVLLRLEFQSAHPILNVTLATDQK